MDAAKNGYSPNSEKDQNFDWEDALSETIMLHIKKYRNEYTESSDTDAQIAVPVKSRMGLVWATLGIAAIWVALSHINCQGNTIGHVCVSIHLLISAGFLQCM